MRNSVANKNMKDMKVGDLAFFYASGGKKGNVPGIVGIMEVVKEAEPDLSAFNENSAYFVENKKMRGTQEKPRWYMVHVEFRKKLSKPVTYVYIDLTVDYVLLTSDPRIGLRSSRSIPMRVVSLRICKSSMRQD